VLFETAGRLADAAAGDPVAAAGEGWALADLAGKLSDPQEAAAARGAAEVALAQACAARWSRNGRALGAMAHLARMDLAGVAPGSPRRMLRALWHRMTGR
jgi:phytoene synthase